MKQNQKQNMTAVKALVITLLCAMPLMSRALEAKYCMSYADYVAGKWKNIDDLAEGRTLRMPQIKYADGEFKVRTGDKLADKILKKDVFAIKYGKQLYVNCRNLRYNEVGLDVSGYSQAYEFGDHMLCVAAYHINTGALLLSVGADVASIFTDTPMSIALRSTSDVIWFNRDKLNSFRCYLIDSDANAKGRYEVIRIDDNFMDTILDDDAPLLARYKAVSRKGERISAANVLPVLMEKGLIKEN